MLTPARVRYTEQDESEQKVLCSSVARGGKTRNSLRIFNRGAAMKITVQHYKNNNSVADCEKLKTLKILEQHLSLARKLVCFLVVFMEGRRTNGLTR